MVQIIEIDEQTLKEIPNVFKLLYELYGPNQIALFATVVDNSLGFVARHGGDCTYIHKDGYNRFTLNEEQNLGAVEVMGYQVFLGENTYYVDKDKREHYLNLENLDEEDELGYNGYVCYRQYNPDNDTFCEMRFQQMYNSTGAVYGYHTKKIDSVHIDEQFMKKGRPMKGILPKTSKYFSRVEFDSDEIGYKWVAIKDYGVLDFLEKGPYELLKGRNVVRYAKTIMINREGNYADLWPFSSQVTPEILEELIKSYGFNTEIPNEIMEIHNGRCKMISTILEIVVQLKTISAEVKRNPESNKYAMLRLRNE